MLENCIISGFAVRASFKRKACKHFARSRQYCNLPTYATMPRCFLRGNSIVQCACACDSYVCAIATGYSSAKLIKHCACKTSPMSMLDSPLVELLSKVTFKDSSGILY